MAKGGAKILFGLFFFVVIVAALAGGGAWFLTEDRPEGYRATAVLILDPGAVTPPDRAPEPSPVDHAQSAFGFAAPTPARGLAAPDYAVLFQSDAVAESVRATLPDGNMTLAEVKAAMEAETQVALQTRDNVVYRRAIQLHFTAPDPALAAKGANTWATACTNFVAKLSVEQQGEREQAIQAQRDALRSELQAARKQLSSLQQSAPLELLALAAESASDTIEDVKQTAREAQANAARGEASLKALKTYVSKAPPAVVLELSMAEATAEAETAGARAESEFLTTQLEKARTEAEEARKAWAKAILNQDQLKETIARLMPRVEALEAELAAVERLAPEVRIAAEAVPPDTPVGPHRYVIVAGAAILGAIAGMIVYFGLLTLRVYARELDRG